MILIGRGLDLKARVEVLSGQLPVQFSRCDGFRMCDERKAVGKAKRTKKSGAKPTEESESEGWQGNRESGCKSAKSKRLIDQ